MFADLKQAKHCEKMENAATENEQVPDAVVVRNFVSYKEKCTKRVKDTPRNKEGESHSGHIKINRLDKKDHHPAH